MMPMTPSRAECPRFLEESRIRSQHPILFEMFSRGSISRLDKEQDCERCAAADEQQCSGPAFVAVVDEVADEPLLGIGLDDLLAVALPWSWTDFHTSAHTVTNADAANVEMHSVRYEEAWRVRNCREPRCVAMTRCTFSPSVFGMSGRCLNSGSAYSATMT